MGSTQNVVVGAANITIDGTDLGFTKDGVTLGSERDYLDVECDQLVGVIKKAKTSEAFNVSTTLLEATQQNLQLAWDLKNLVSAGEIGDGFSNEVNEHTLGLEGVGPDGQTYNFTFHRAVSVGNAEVAWSKDEEIALDVEFNCMKNDSGIFGTVSLA